MFDFLKKLGLPAAIAGLVAGLVVVIPMLFKIDERYAKTEELAKSNQQLAEQINDLSIEVGKLAGTAQVLVAIMSTKTNNVPIVDSTQPARPTALLVTPIAAADEDKKVLAPKSPEEAIKQLTFVSGELASTQKKVQSIQSNIAR
jgi:hypothetical protein